MEGTIDAFTSGTIPSPRHNLPEFPFKYYISKVGGGGVSDLTYRQAFDCEILSISQNLPISVL